MKINYNPIQPTFSGKRFFKEEFETADLKSESGKAAYYQGYKNVNKLRDYTFLGLIGALGLSLFDTPSSFFNALMKASAFAFGVIAFGKTILLTIEELQPEKRKIIEAFEKKDSDIS